MRTAEFDALFSEAVQAIARPEPTRLRLDLIFTAENAARTAELAARENCCCSFFVFTFTIADGAMALEMRVPEEQTEVLEALQRRAETAALAGAGPQPI